MGGERMANCDWLSLRVFGLAGHPPASSVAFFSTRLN